ncbi:MAG: 50S ribosomal protein L15 [Spartobacteria bacterium]|nr:50S ribosomal protein L15 [Spartobacteria bacterium]
MSLHAIKNSVGARKDRMRVGRGRASGKGKTSGRGHKGQMARKGASHRPAFEGGQMPLIRRLPKRGFTHIKAKIWAPVNVAALACFDEGTEVTFELLRKTGLAKGRIDGVKILGRGDLDKKLTVKAQAFSESARSKIEAAGGQCEVTK